MARARDIKVTERDRKALELRKAGKTFDTIAHEIGWAHRSVAYRAVDRALRATLQEPADELRRLEAERLNMLLDSMWDQATAGKGWAVDRVLSIMDRRARLLGLDAPRRQELYVVTEDVIDQEIRRLEAQLAENDGAHDEGRPA